MFSMLRGYTEINGAQVPRVVIGTRLYTGLAAAFSFVGMLHFDRWKEWKRPRVQYIEYDAWTSRLRFATSWLQWLSMSIPVNWRKWRRKEEWFLLVENDCIEKWLRKKRRIDIRRYQINVAHCTSAFEILVVASSLAFCKGTVKNSSWLAYL